MWWLVLACTAETPTSPPPEALVASLTFPGEVPASPPVYGDPWSSPQGYTVRPLALGVRDGFQVGAALFQPETAVADAGVVVANGHFDKAKSGPDTQHIAHRLAARGLTVLIVDNPGSEEFGTRDRALHFDRGAHNRAFLNAGGTSALALQLASLSAGLDLLQDLGLRRVVATGASGGAVLSFWLAVVDPRVVGAVMAAAPAVPRVPAPGCDCKQLFGTPGPDPQAVGWLRVPSLWMKESPAPRPEGLPDSAEWKVVAGDHAYTDAMQREAVAWIDNRLDHSSEVWLEDPPLLELRSTPGPGPRRAIFDLPLDPDARWTPAPADPVDAQVQCTGTGPTVLVLGRGPIEGLRSCVVQLGEVPWAVDAGHGRVAADRVVAALQAQAREHEAQALWGFGGHGVAVAGAGLPFVLESPRRAIDQVDVDADPVWMHVPGLWWGGADPLYADALASGDEGALLDALAGG